MKRMNFYKGYEGEPEVRFSLYLNDRLIHEVRCWDGHLMFIIEHAHQTKNGWTGIARAYHSGWLEEGWIIDNIYECKKDLLETDISEEDIETHHVYQALIELLEQAIEMHGKVRIIIE